MILKSCNDAKNVAVFGTPPVKEYVTNDNTVAKVGTSVFKKHSVFLELEEREHGTHGGRI